jgi:hypothetical protein
MRNAGAQYAVIMLACMVRQQASRPHVRHAKSGRRVTRDYEGQRCALLTTKSRNTCTRATVFNSSG